MVYKTHLNIRLEGCNINQINKKSGIAVYLLMMRFNIYIFFFVRIKHCLAVERSEFKACRRRYCHITLLQAGCLSRIALAHPCICNIKSRATRRLLPLVEVFRSWCCAPFPRSQFGWPCSFLASGCDVSDSESSERILVLSLVSQGGGAEVQDQVQAVQ